MFNRIEAYSEAGRKAGQARKEKDEGRAAHWSDYARRMWSCETAGADRTAARKAFDDAYRDAAAIPVRYFR